MRFSRRLNQTCLLCQDKDLPPFAAIEGITAQTRRHIHLLSLVGIKELCMVVNKMDLVGFDQAIFDGIVAGMTELLSQVGIAQFICVPASALHGINVAKKGVEMAWYSGPTLLEALDTLRFKPFTLRSLRFPVQDVYDMDDGPVLVGRVESGEVVRGMVLERLPGGDSVGVKEIRKFPERDLDRAGFGEIAKVKVHTENDIVVDPFTSIPEMGRFVIERCGIPVGGGIVH